MTKDEKKLWDQVYNPITGRSDHYRLVGQSVQPVSLGEWATSMEHENRRVRLTRIGPFEVSTVFLGLDHNFSGVGPPVIFETMTFLRGVESGEEIDNEQDGRSCTWTEAEAMHQRAVDWIVQHRAAPGEKSIEITGDDASTARSEVKT